MVFGKMDPPIPPSGFPSLSSFHHPPGINSIFLIGNLLQRNDYLLHVIWSIKHRLRLKRSFNYIQRTIVYQYHGGSFKENGKPTLWRQLRSTGLLWRENGFTTIFPVSTHNPQFVGYITC